MVVSSDLAQHHRTLARWCFVCATTCSRPSGIAMNSIDFRTIRPLRGSQNNGFEEICCQLAACEEVPENSRFIRNGTPDGGVESYWVRPDGSEHGWQAKLFFDIEQSQWQQLDKSITTALDKHPRLTRYTICLPIDLPDARVQNQQSLRQKWDARVVGWEAEARSRNMVVTFDLWGQSQLLTRLALEKHAGRCWFWFRQIELSPVWFTNHLKEATAAAGPRYTPELNVRLPIVERFEALGYTAVFRHRLAGARHKCREAFQSIKPRGEKPDESQELKKYQTALVDTWDELESSIAKFGDIPPKGEHLGIVSKAIYGARASVIDLADHVTKEAQEREAAAVTQPGAPARQSRQSDGEGYGFRQFRISLDELGDFLDVSSAELAGQPALLLAGDAGSGKTHLLCDVANHRVRGGYPSVVLLGQQLEGGEIWSQIITRLGLRCTRDELLGALDALGEASGSRAVLFIDALNEAVDVKWRDELPAMIAVLVRFPHVGLAVSCRSTYEALLVRDDLLKSGLLSRVEHDGFAPKLFEALAAFCRYYGIETLNAPPLDPEFENPLFLKLFCQGLRNRGLTRPPKGHTGFQRIFSFLLDSVNEKLSNPSELDFPSSDPIVRRAVEAIADAMLAAGRYDMPRGEAQTLLDRLLPRPGQGYSRSLLRKLIAEGVLADDFVWKRGQDDAEAVIRFGYERMADYQIASRLLDRHVKGTDVDAAFALGGPFRRIFSEDQAYRWRGLLAAMTVFVPERYGREVADLLPYLRSNQALRDAFLEALPWRQAEHVSSATLAFVEELLQGTNSSSRHSASDTVLDRLVQLAAQPEHPLNARWVHARLKPLSLAERDYQWSTFLHRTRAAKAWQKPGAVERLLDWGWQENAEFVDPCMGFDDEVVSLAATIITWCFTSSNRFIRDRATKALVSILQHRVRLALGLLTDFAGVDDPYVVERLHAAVYGAVMRSNDRDAVAHVAQAVFQNVFVSGSAPADVLIRDYARGVIECALHLGCSLNLDLSRIRPPYQSDQLPETLPTWEELRKKYEGSDFVWLIFSLEHRMGDFARYVLGSDSYDMGLNTWTDQPDPFEEARARAAERIDLPQPLAARRWEVVGWNLTPKIHVVENVDPPAEEENDDFISPLPDPVLDEEELKRELAEQEEKRNTFLASLSNDERELVARYEAAEERWRDANEAARKIARSYDLPPDYGCRWIMTRVMELGWTPEKFAAFDRAVNEHNMREAMKAERIGKKYQWIAYHELAARTFDHRPFHYSDFEGCQVYEGPWQKNFRDIDPSFLVRTPPPEPPTGTSWWLRLNNPLTGVQLMGDRQWLVDRDSIPDLSPILSVQRRDDGATWYALNANGEWKEDEQERETRRGTYRRNVSFSAGSFLVPSANLFEVIDAVREFEWTGMDVAAGDFYDRFLGEFPWAPSYRELEAHAAAELTAPCDSNTSQLRKIPNLSVAVAHTTMRYSHSGHGFDCSTTESISGVTPSLWLARRMRLSWGRRRFNFVDHTGRVVAYDPSHEAGGEARGLLIETGAFQRFLRASGLSLVWLLIGEKLILNGSNSYADEDRPVIEVFRQAYTLSGDRIERVSRTVCPLGGKPEEY